MVLALSARGHRRAIERWFAADVLLLFALLVSYWIALWGVSPFSLEGWWQYGLAIAALIGAVLVGRGRSHPSRSDRAAQDLRF